MEQSKRACVSVARSILNHKFISKKLELYIKVCTESCCSHRRQGETLVSLHFYQSYGIVWQSAYSARLTQTLFYLYLEIVLCTAQHLIPFNVTVLEVVYLWNTPIGQQWEGTHYCHSIQSGGKTFFPKLWDALVLNVCAVSNVIHWVSL